MKKTNAFTDPKTSFGFKLMGMFLFTMLIVIPPAIFLAGVGINGVFNTLNILPLISALCSFFFFKILNKDQENFYKKAVTLSALLLGFTLCVIFFLVYSL